MKFTFQHITALDDLLREAAQQEILPRFRNASTEIRQKTGPQDLVTAADIAAESFITAGLARRYTGALVVGEEAASADPSLLGKLAGADLAFVVDPVDGTANFAAGVPLFGTMAAAIIKGEVVASVIHDPITNSSSLALRGAGAWERAADGATHDLRVAPAAPVEAMIGAASWRYLPPSRRGVVLQNLQKCAQVWDFRCAAHEYRMLCAGHCHFLLFNRLMPWDHLPGVLLHHESGGYAARFDGSAYVPGHTDGGLICAPDAASFAALLGALLGGTG